MRINEMITKEKMPRSFIKFSQLILKGNVWRSVWRICMWILGLKGLKLTYHAKSRFGQAIFILTEVRRNLLLLLKLLVCF